MTLRVLIVTSMFRKLTITSYILPIVLNKYVNDI